MFVTFPPTRNERHSVFSGSLSFPLNSFASPAIRSLLGAKIRIDVTHTTPTEMEGDFCHRDASILTVVNVRIG